MKTAKEVQEYVINYLNVCIEHHDKLMKENSLNSDYYYADKHKTLRDIYVGQKCQMEADFNLLKI